MIHFSSNPPSNSLSQPIVIANPAIDPLPLRSELEAQLAHVRALLAHELAASPKTAPKSLSRSASESALKSALAPNDACLTCSFQAEDVLLLYLVRALHPAIPVLFLDTGYHFAETYAYRDRLAREWNLNLTSLLPSATVEEQELEHGTLFDAAPDRCCALRKVEPLFTAVASYKIWLTGLRREQARSRTTLEEAAPFLLPSGITVRKLSPFADWTTRDVWQLCAHFGIPLLPLYDQDYTSIGCAPCTTLPTDPNDPRSGRWAGKKRSAVSTSSPPPAKACSQWV